MNLSKILPFPFRKIMGEFDLGFIEKRATCDDCLMARSAGGFAYKATLKCCTYFPFLYNFQVGAILTEAKAPSEIVEKLKGFIKTDQAQPLGVAADYHYQKKFLKRGTEAFGRDPELLCPYFDKKHFRCGIWTWRGGVCTSFYCESSYGIKGIEFWREFEKYFLLLESTLSFDALLNLGFDEVEGRSCLMALPKTAIKAFRFNKNLWQEMGVDRVELYIKTFQYINSLSSQNLQKLLGEECLSLQANLYEKAAQLACK